jgi:hypothetical protein
MKVNGKTIQINDPYCKIFIFRPAEEAGCNKIGIKLGVTPGKCNTGNPFV